VDGIPDCLNGMLQGIPKETIVEVAKVSIKHADKLYEITRYEELMPIVSQNF
jgi:hypothetical protein